VDEQAGDIETEVEESVTAEVGDVDARIEERAVEEVGEAVPDDVEGIEKVGERVEEKVVGQVEEKVEELRKTLTSVSRRYVRR